MAQDEKQEGTGADESAAEKTGTDTAQASGERQEEKRFTQAELDDIVQARVAKAERSAEKRVRKELESGQSKETKSEQKAEQKAEQKFESPDVSELKARVAFSEALEDLDWKPSKADRDVLRDMFLAKGADAMERLAERLKPAAQAAPAAGAEKKAEAKGESKGGEEKAAEKTGPGYRSPGAPNGAPRSPDDVPATQWTQDDIDRMKRDGTFKKSLDRFGSNLGGEHGLFQRRMPK